MIQAVIGQGKFGTVYSANHLTTGKTVAVKMLTKKNMKADILELQRREIEVLKIC